MAQGPRPRAGWIGFSLTLVSLGCASTGMNPKETKSPLPLPSRLPAPNAAGINPTAVPTGATGNPSLPPKLNVSPPANPQAKPQAYRRPSGTDAGFTDLRSVSSIATPTMPTTAGTQYGTTTPVRPASHVTPVSPTPAAPTVVPATATEPVVTVPVSTAAPPIATPTPPQTTTAAGPWKEATPTVGLTSPVPVEKPPTVTATVEPPEAGWIQSVPPLRDRTTDEAPKTGGVIMPPPIISAAGGM